MSPYFPKHTAREESYWCPNCEGYYRKGPIDVSCCVMHAPGSCCHFGEQRIPDDALTEPYRRASQGDNILG